MQQIALTVDDDQHTRLFMKQILSGFDMQIVQAEDGAQAIDILEQVTPSILFLDLLLPEVSGVEVLDFIAHTPRLNNMFVAVVSAHSNAPNAAELARADTYLVKPVRLQVIRDLISAPFLTTPHNNVLSLNPRRVPVLNPPVNRVESEGSLDSKLLGYTSRNGF